MKLSQLSLFIENKSAHLKAPCRALARAGINIVTLSLADTEQFGILRIIVREPEKALEVLKAAGCLAKVTEVIAIDVPDHPGGLADLLDVVDACALNIEYMYAFTCRMEDKATMVFRFDDPDAAVRALQEKGVNVISRLEVFRRTEQE